MAYWYVECRIRDIEESLANIKDKNFHDWVILYSRETETYMDNFWYDTTLDRHNIITRIRNNIKSDLSKSLSIWDLPNHVDDFTAKILGLDDHIYLDVAVGPIRYNHRLDIHTAAGLVYGDVRLLYKERPITLDDVKPHLSSFKTEFNIDLIYHGKVDNINEKFMKGIMSAELILNKKIYKTLYYKTWPLKLL